MRSGAANHMWKGGRVVASSGYILVRVGRKHHLADVRGYAYEHRIEAEKKLGRRLLLGELVHHIDGDRANNVHENLEVVSSNAEHFLHHRTRDDLRRPGEENPTVVCACGCGTHFERYDACGRPRRFVSGHNPAPAPTMDALLRALERGPRHVASLTRDAGLSRKAVASSLSKMRRMGFVTTDGHGTWRRTEVHHGS